MNQTILEAIKKKNRLIGREQDKFESKEPSQLEKINHTSSKQEPKRNSKIINSAKEMLEKQFGSSCNKLPPPPNLINNKILTPPHNLPPPPPLDLPPPTSTQLPLPPLPSNYFSLSTNDQINEPSRYPKSTITQVNQNTSEEFPSTRPRTKYTHIEHTSSHIPFQNPRESPETNVESAFIISEVKKDSHENLTRTEVTAWNPKELKQTQRKKILSKTSPRYPLTQEVLGKNLAGSIKQTFLKTVSINNTINMKVQKLESNFNFPSITKKYRQVEPFQTFYADMNVLDPVSCFCSKNFHVEKIHKDSRDTFLTTFQNYDWRKDPLRLRLIRESAKDLPDSNFIEPNFASIKNGIDRCRNIIETLAKNRDFSRCNQLNKMIVETENSLVAYCEQPQSNVSLLDQIYENVAYMKGLSL